MKSHFLFVALLNPHLVIDIGAIKLVEPLYLV